MLDAEIQSRIVLPPHLQRFQKLKKESEQVATRIRPLFPKYADRIDKCMDIVHVNQFQNGWVDINNNKKRLCHVRFCPICERTRKKKILGRINSGIISAKRENPSHKWLLATFSVYQGDRTLKQAFSVLNDGVSRLVRLKAFRASGYVRIANVDIWGETFLPSISLLMCCSASFASGRDYISRKRWQELWSASAREDVPAPKTKSLKGDRKQIIEVVAPLGKIDASIVPDSRLKEYVEGVSKVRMVDFCGACDRWMEDKPREKKQYYQSEKKALAKMNKRFFGYMPNPDNQNYDNEYLEFFDLPEWSDGLDDFEVA